MASNLSLNPTSTTSSLLDNEEIETKYNQVKHLVEIYLDNTNGNSLTDRYTINPNAIVNLTIEDTLSDWVTRGTLTFMFNPEGEAGSTNSDTGQSSSAATGLNSGTGQFYSFRNDGNDRLRIRIVPNTQAQNSAITGQIAVPDLVISDKKFWTISHVFSVYDMEDVDLPPGAQNAASATIKCLKLYFWDYIFQKLSNTVIEYSTALSSSANIEGDKSTGYEQQGLINTGRAMKEIIDVALSETKTMPVAGTVTPEANLNMPYSFTADIGEEWEEGPAKIFYTTPTEVSAYESLQYVLERHISQVAEGSSNDFSLLIKEKGPNEKDQGYLTLRPVSHFFEKAGNGAEDPGDYQIEHFFLQGYTGDKNTPTKLHKAPLSKNSTSDKVDVKSLKYNQITNYRFVDIAAHTNTREFANRPVYSFDYNQRLYKVEFQNNSVKAARTFMSKKYIDKLYKNGTAEDLFLITIDKDREHNNMNPIFSNYGDNVADGGALIRQSSGLHNLLYTGLFQNAAINFRCLGLTFREPGRFIGIDRTEGVEDGDFQNKFYGQWFVINVKHIFEAEIYYNDITAVKLHRFQKAEKTFQDTI
jgi:hypothetical protein